MRKIPLSSLVIIGLLVDMSGLAFAATIDFFTLGANAKLPNQVYVSPKTYAGIDLRGPFGEIADGSGWAVAQWGPGQPLTEILDCQGNCTDGVWKLSSADGRQIFRAVNHSSTNGTVYRLIQNTYGTTPADCANSEVDLHLEPVSSLVYPDFVSGFISFPSRITLGDASEFHVAVDIDIASSEHQNGYCASGLNLHTVIIGLVLRNFAKFPILTTTNQNGSLFYQIVIRDSRGFSANGYWFFQTVPWGVSDSIDQVYGLSQQIPGSKFVSYDLNFRDRLSSLISNSPYLPPDARDPGEWIVTSFYLQSAVNGEGKGNVRFRKPRLYAIHN